MTSSFLIIGNGRCGSTWLETSLDQLSELACRREFKWPSPLYELNEFHLKIDFETNSIVRELDEFYEDHQESAPRPINGSKLIFDLYPLLTPKVFGHISDALDVGVNIVQIKRNYIELFLSWRARFGIVHQISPAALGNHASIDPLLVSTFDTEVPEAAKSRNIWLTNNGRRLVSDREPGLEGVDFETSAVVEDLLSFFYNDISVVGISKFCTNSMVVDYKDIKKRFTEIARFVGATSNDSQLLTPIDTPTTQKLPPLSPNLIRPMEKVLTLSELLDKSFWDVVQGNRDPAEVVALDEENNSLVFRVSGLSAAVDDLVLSGNKIDADVLDPDVFIWKLHGETNGGTVITSSANVHEASNSSQSEEK